MEVLQATVGQMLVLFSFIFMGYVVAKNSTDMITDT